MLLNFKELGDPGARPILALHGLLGSMRNWTSAGRLLAERYRVILVDARNHGGSVHTSTHSFVDMVEDLLELLDHLGLDTATIIGHSMGGKVAMALACRYPERVDQIFVVDSAPKDYPAMHDREFEAMYALDLANLESRGAADDHMAKYFDDWAFRQFLISNVIRAEDGSFKWLVNLPVIEASLLDLAKNPLSLDDVFEGKTAFLKGGKSNYIQNEDFTDIRFHFPKATIDTWDDSGHNPHFEHRNRFVEWVNLKLNG